MGECGNGKDTETVTMTLAELKTLLSTNTAEIPVAFDHFKTAQSLPYMIYIVTGNDNFAADNGAYYKDSVIQLELYTELKSETTEAVVEAVLDSVPFFYSKDEGYLDDEQMYMVTYRFVL